MPIAFINDVNVVNSGGGNTTATRPTGSNSAANITWAAWTIYDQDASATGLPAGWTLIVQGYNAAGGNSFTLKTAWALGNVADLVFPGPASRYQTLYTGSYSGANTSTPIDSGAGAPTYAESESANGTATGTGITITDADTFLLWAMSGYSEGIAAVPTGMNSRELNYDGVNSVADLSVAAGATGNKSATMNNNAVWAVVMFGLRPAAGGAATSRDRPNSARRQMTRGPHLRMVRRDRIYVPAHLAG